MHNCFQLNLLENYLLKLKYSRDMKGKNMRDFGYLCQSSAIKKGMNQASCDSKSIFEESKTD